MTEKQLVEAFRVHVERLIQRFNLAVEGLSADQVNAHPNGVHWGIAEVTEHMKLALGHYSPVLFQGLETAKPSDGAAGAKQTFWGKLIEYGSGPRKASPAPRSLYPAPGPYTVDSLASFEAEHRLILDKLEAAGPVELSATRVRNPFMKFIRMNLADMLLVIAAHAERHVGQIEDMAAALKTSSRS